MELTPLTRAEIDKPKRCGSPECNIIHMNPDYWVHSVCHPKTPTWCRYKDGVLTITCAVCKKPISAYKIAAE